MGKKRQNNKREKKKKWEKNPPQKQQKLVKVGMCLYSCFHRSVHFTLFFLSGGESDRSGGKQSCTSSSPPLFSHQVTVSSVLVWMCCMICLVFRLFCFGPYVGRKRWVVTVSGRLVLIVSSAAGGFPSQPLSLDEWSIPQSADRCVKATHIQGTAYGRITNTCSGEKCTLTQYSILTNTGLKNNLCTWTNQLWDSTWTCSHKMVRLIFCIE